jgi:Mg2+/citrate symporter
MNLLNYKRIKNNMKKTYMHPEMEIVEIKSQVLLAGSLGVYNETITGSEMLAPEFETDLGEVLAPETHYWEF